MGHLRVLLESKDEFRLVEHRCDDCTLFQMLLSWAEKIKCLEIKQAHVILFPTLLLSNLRSLTIENTNLGIVELPGTLRCFIARNCTYVHFSKAMFELETLELIGNGCVKGTEVLEKSPLESITLEGNLDFDFVKQIKVMQSIPGLKRLVLSQNFSTRDGFFLAFWYGLEYLKVGSFEFFLAQNELIEATQKLAAKELAYLPGFSIGDVVFELATQVVARKIGWIY